MSDDIVTWLRACIAEDEADWRMLQGEQAETLLISVWRDRPLANRMLAVCAAHRAIIDEHDTREIASLESETWGQPFNVCRRCKVGERQVVAPCPTILALASIYSDRPGYNPDWSIT